MDLIPFGDHCDISRGKRGAHGVAQRDKYDEQIIEPVYSGACYFRRGTQGLAQIVTRSDTVYIPQGIELRVGDIVKVQTVYSGEVMSVVSNSRVCRLTHSGECITKVELSQSEGR